jgi:N-acetyl-1-D-myo-inositol-2-amino-2-deoxy-alpha-D-glucopyranoside deacetylase
MASVLAVFAHPDDESLAAGGALALSAARGHRVSLLCLTRGEGRSVLISDAEAVAHIRARELADAARHLGMTTVRLETFRDGYLPWEDATAVQAHIRTMIDDVQADVVVTFDEDGLYWHPDHIAVHQHVMGVVAAMGPAAPAVFCVTMPAGQMRELASGLPVLGIAAEAFGADAPAPTWRLNVADVIDAKVTALRAHHSQVTGDPLESATPAQLLAALGMEHYRCAHPGPGGADWQHSLEARHD